MCLSSENQYFSRSDKYFFVFILIANDIKYISMEFFPIILLVVLMQMMTIGSLQSVPHLSQQRAALEHLIPLEHSCIINWILETGPNCEWCEAMFSPLIRGLTQEYHPSSIRIIDATASPENEFWNVDLKGTCSVNWFMAENFKKILDIVESPKSNRPKIDDWFLYIRVSFVFYVHVLIKVF